MILLKPRLGVLAFTEDDAQENFAYTFFDTLSRFFACAEK